MGSQFWTALQDGCHLAEVIMESDFVVLMWHLQLLGHDMRVPPVSSQNRKDSSFFGRDGLVPSAIARFLQLPLVTEGCRQIERM